MTNSQLRPVNPESPYQAVFVFPILKTVNERGSVYEATRRLWTVSTSNRGLSPAVAVGVERDRSLGVFEIDSWTPLPDPHKWEFSGKEISVGHELANTDWRTIRIAAKGFFGFGQYLIVEFDGQGRFRLQRGSANKEWQPL